LAQEQMVKLDYHIFKSVVNAFFGLFVGRRTRPTFFDIDRAYPALDHVTRAYPVIRKEFDRLTTEWSELPQYHEIDPGERAISDTTPKRWNVFLLEIMGHRPQYNRACCPETCRALEQVPNMIQAFFSILDPGKSVPEHEGPYLGYLRYHLGVRVPARNPPKLIVNAQDYVWAEGKAVLFDDSWPHSVVNTSSEPRAVLIVDVRRPLPFFADLVNRLVVDVIGRHTYGRGLARKAEAFAAAQRQVKRIAA
jgi:aspartyl/asparaginyl beta-hydroxylase (cupin superfamily)